MSRKVGRRLIVVTKGDGETIVICEFSSSQRGGSRQSNKRGEIVDDEFVSVGGSKKISRWEGLKV
jgi:hypothetical protein